MEDWKHSNNLKVGNTNDANVSSKCAFQCIVWNGLWEAQWNRSSKVYFQQLTQVSACHVLPNVSSCPFRTSWAKLQYNWSLSNSSDPEVVYCSLHVICNLTKLQCIILNQTIKDQAYNLKTSIGYQSFQSWAKIELMCFYPNALNRMRDWCYSVIIVFTWAVCGGASLGNVLGRRVCWTGYLSLLRR